MDLVTVILEWPVWSVVLFYSCVTLASCTVAEGRESTGGWGCDTRPTRLWSSLTFLKEPVKCG